MSLNVVLNTANIPTHLITEFGTNAGGNFIRVMDGEVSRFLPTLRFNGSSQIVLSLRANQNWLLPWLEAHSLNAVLEH